MNEINESNVIEFFSSIGFGISNGEENIWIKKYKKHNGYEIKIELKNESFKSSKIDYGDEISIGRKTTCNFSQQENFVVLECVDRLLEKGYSPKSIILEKDWKLGHNEGGNLDIQVLDEKGKSFIMIECKTWESEYKKEIQKTYLDGGQVFSYYNQDKNTKYLCLYTSTLDNRDIQYKTSIIKVTEDIASATTSQEAFERWKPQVFETNGLFESSTKAYSLLFAGIRKRDLIPLTKDDGGDIFNRFAEILRRNVVSDKTNAYNKIFNLFLCKIVDEYQSNDEEKVRFQWEEGESNEDVLLRLNELYKEGMSTYLDLNISSIDMDDIDKQLKGLKTQKDKENIKKLFIEQKLYTSNDFAFKEVFDKKTFDLNCIVVKEVVKLLERYKIRYETKQQFLGDFFEKLLNTGIKQEVGQYFTPVPVAQFICKCVPVERIIKEKNSKKENFILPYVIDYASGSGHFLTEVMEEINHHIEKIDDKFFNNAHARKEFNKHKNNFDWAEEYIYGIEKDYRLAKTTKIATFLNGDGDATIVFGDGLDSFNKSEDYKGKLKTSKNKNNSEFDILITNPPYSVSGFKTTLKYGKESFELFEFLTDKSNEIECLFIERAKQLLKVNGVAGIILPSSILSNTGMYTKAREFLFKYFETIGIVELGSKTFMKTGTNTIILFLKRIEENKQKEILQLVDDSINTKRDIAINGIRNPIATYLKAVFSIDFDDFASIINKNPNKKIESLDIFKEYEEEFNKSNEMKSFMKKKEFVSISEDDKKKLLTQKLCEFIVEKEKEKIYYFILTYNQKLTLIKVPKNINKQRDFLGYSFSERRGNEGIKIHKDEEGKKLTRLFDEDDLDNPEKANYYIRSAYAGKNEEIPESLHGIVFQQDLRNLIDFSRVHFEKQINLNPKVEFETKYNKVKLKKKYLVQKGKSITEKDTKEGKIPVIGAGKKPAYYHESSNRDGKTITISASGANAGFVSYYGIPIFASDCSTITSLDEKEASTKYLYHILSINQEKIYYLQRGNAQPHVYPTDLENLQIPFPDKTTQDKIASDLDILDNEIKKIGGEAEKLSEKYHENIKKIFNGKYQIKKLSKICEVVRGSSPRPKGDPKYFTRKDTGIHWISISDLTKYKRNKYLENTSEFLTKEGKEKSRYLEKGALIVTNSGTVGVPAILNINGCIHDGYLTFINWKEDISKDYLYYVFTGLREYLEGIAPEGSQKNLNTTIVENLDIPFPDKTTQDKIASELDELKKRIEENENQIKKIIERKQNILEKELN